MLKEQCDGEWERVTVDHDGSFVVHNNALTARRFLGLASSVVRRAAPPPTSPSASVAPPPARKAARKAPAKRAPARKAATPPPRRQWLEPSEPVRAPEPPPVARPSVVPQQVETS